MLQLSVSKWWSLRRQVELLEMPLWGLVEEAKLWGLVLFGGQL